MAGIGTKKRGVSGRDGQVAALIASGNTQTEVAVLMKMAIRTVARIVAKPEVRHEVDRIRSIVIETGLGILCDGFVNAVRQLHRIVREGSPADSVKLGAVRLAIDSVLKVRESVSMARELAELRALYESSNAAEPTPGDGDEAPDGPDDDGDTD